MSKTEFAGLLREHIRIERPLAQRDGLGAASVQTELVGEYWASAEATGNGGEAQSEARRALQQWQFTLRQTDMILPGDHLIWSGREMLVRTVSEDRRLLPRTILLAEERR